MPPAQTLCLASPLCAPFLYAARHACFAAHVRTAHCCLPQHALLPVRTPSRLLWWRCVSAEE